MRITGLILILLTATTHAGILLDEHFVYGDGILQEVSAGKWTGHSGETNQVDVVDGEVNLTAKETQDVNAPLPNGPYSGASGAILYASFKVKFSALPTKTGSYFAHFKSTSATGFRSRVWAALTPDKMISLGITSSTSSNPVLHPIPLELNSTHRVVIRLDVGTSLTSLWIDPSTEADANVQSDTGAPLTITSFALRQASGIGTLQIDDIVVATTFEELTGQQPGSPLVIHSPESLTITAGMPATFSVEAAGSDPLLYQWFFNDEEIQGATNSTFQISQSTHANAGAYKAKISNSVGFALSENAILAVDDPILPPIIVRSPDSAVVVAGQGATFEVIATGTEPREYQWYFSGHPLPLETNSILSISNVDASAAGPYRVTVSNSAGIAFSDTAMLTVTDPELSPTITSEPVSLTTIAGESADFSVNAIGTGPLFYQWFFKENPLAGETNFFLHLSQVTEPDSGEYQVRITNHKGSAVSTIATLTVRIPAVPPAISRQPESIEVATSETAIFSVSATGTEPISFQWHKDGQPLATQTNATLVLVDVTANQSGNYFVFITNEAGSVQSDSVLLQVKPPPIAMPPTIIFTNFLTHLVRPGDLETNTFRELVLQPGERLRLEIAVLDRNSLPMSVRWNTNGFPTEANWTILANSPTNQTGTFEFIPADALAGHNYTLQVEAADAQTTNQLEWQFYIPTIEEQNIVITEFLVNPDISADSPYFNPLHRSITQSILESDDQYLEIANLWAGSIEFKGWTISDGFKVWHRFDQSFSVQSSNAVIVYGGSSTGSEPILEAPAIAAHGEGSGLVIDANGGTFLLRNPDGHLISRVVYGSLSDRFTTCFPDANGAFAAQESVSTHLFSPGKKWNGEPFLDRPTPIPIGNIKIEPFGVDRVRITWKAQAGQSYSVMHAPTLTKPFEPIGNSFQFPNEIGEYIGFVDFAEGGYYLVRSP